MNLTKALSITLLIFFAVSFTSCSTSRKNQQEAMIQINKSSGNADIFTVVEVQPEFPGGDEAKILYLQKNIQYPAEARKAGIQGTVYVTFVVEKDGSLTNPRILRGIGGGCDEEVIRLISHMPKWKPGMQRGNAVRVQYNMPVKFTLAK